MPDSSPGSPGPADGTGVLRRAEGPVLRLTLDRQETRNALAAAGMRALTAALDDAATDPAVRVVVLDHAGPVFCSGADLRVAAGARPEDQPVAMLPAVLQRIRSLPVPVVGVADGKIRAGGVGLFAACDLTVASPRCDVATTEVRLGLVPAVISPAVLARLGGSAARRWFLTGDVVDAAGAHRDGLVDVLADDVAAATAGLVDSLVRGGPQALAATKALLHGDVTAEALAARYRDLAQFSAGVFASPEGQEGIAAQRARRPAAWVPTP